MIGQIEGGVLPQRPVILLRMAAALGVKAPRPGTLPGAFAQALNARMLRRQVNVTELAAATGVSRGAAAQWLTGAHPRARTLAAITALLGDPGQQMHRAWQQHQRQRPMPGGLTCK